MPFPPQKPKTATAGKPKPGAGKSASGGFGQAKKPFPKEGKTPFQSSKPSDSGDFGDETASSSPFGDETGMGDGTALMAMQNAQMEHEQEQERLRQEKEAAEAAEQEKLKAMRIKADSEVMDDLISGNDKDDTVIFYPSFFEEFAAKLDMHMMKGK